MSCDIIISHHKAKKRLTSYLIMSGKTATVRDVLKHINDGDYDYQMIEINGMKLSDPKQLYSLIYRVSLTYLISLSQLSHTQLCRKLTVTKYDV